MFFKNNEVSEEVNLETKLKIKKIPFAVIPNIILITISIGMLIFLFMYYSFELTIPVVTIKILDIIILFFILFGLLKKNEKAVGYMFLIQFFIGIAGIIFSYYNKENVGLNSFLTLIPYLLIFLISSKFYGKGKKKIFFVLYIISTLIFLYYFIDALTYDSDTRFETLLIYLSTYTKLMLWLSIIFWIFNPYKYVDEIIVLTKKKKGLIALSTIFLSALSIFVSINVYMIPYRYTDEQIELFEKLAEFNNEVVIEMISDLKYDGKDFDLPYSVSDLPDEFSIITVPSPIALYDIQCTLTYNDEIVAVISKTPTNEKGSKIYAFSISDRYTNCEKFTISGIGIGSTVEDLKKTFPNFCLESDTLVVYGDKDFTKATSDSILFNIENEIITGFMLLQGGIWHGKKENG